MKKRAFTIRAWAVGLTLLMALPAWPATPTISPELPDPGRVSMTREQQQKLGLQAMGEVYKQMPVLPDSSPVTQYIQQLGRKLVTVVPPEHSWPYQFHVIQQKDINAFALPGGPIFINIGTITAADNEAELAGVMAHEMSHVYMQHSAKQMPKQEWAGIVSALGGLLGGSAIGNLARMGIQFGAGSLLMKYSRGDEAQADAVGAIIMYKAGYNPRAMAEFFQKLEQQYGNGGPQFLSDHPNPGNRVEAVDKEIANWRPKSYLGTSDAFVKAKADAARVKAYSAQQIADGAKTGAWAQQNQQGGSIPASVPVSGNAGGGAAGATHSNVSLRQVMPSDNFKQLRTSSFSIAYPENWQTGSDQSGVTIAPAAGVAQGAISYGVVIGTANPNANNLDDATQDLIESLQQTNRGLRQSGSPQSIQVNGLQGRSVKLTSTSPVEQDGRAQLERDWLVTVARPSGGLLYLVFIAPENDFSQLRPTYEKILDSLQLR
jgi:Zn-dependent protease with chaperone function